MAHKADSKSLSIMKLYPHEKKKPSKVKTQIECSNPNENPDSDKYTLYYLKIYLI